MILGAVTQLAKEQGLHEQFSGEQNFNKILEIRAGKFNEIENDYLTIQFDLETPEDVKEKVTKIIEDTKAKLNSSLEVEYEQKLSVGNKLPNFGLINNVFSEGTSELAAKQGQVLLIDVWATWCGPCQKPMAHNEEMLEKNNWGDKVRIVGVSVDDQVQSIKDRVEAKGWKRIEHLTLGGWLHDHKLIKSFSINGIPFVCLVNTKGEIVFTGHPSSINLEETINKLIKEEGGQKAEAKQSASSHEISNEAAQKLRSTVGKKQYFEQQFGKLEFISTRIEIKAKSVKGKVSQTATAKVYVNKENKDVLQLYEKILESQDVKFEGKIVECYDVPDVPPACSGCQTELKYPLYWCKWSENPADFRCRECVQKKVSEKVYNYQKNSVLLFGPTKSVAKSNLGENLQPANIGQVTYPHQFGCNGCGGCPSQIGEARYICAGCRSEPNLRGDYVDLCEDCLNKYANNDEDIFNALAPDGHDKKHPFLRVLYNVKGYYKF